MHAIAVQLAPVLAAEKSKVPFYIAGGLLILWALTVSLVLGRRGDFPSTIQGQRGVIAVTAILVIASDVDGRRSRPARPPRRRPPTPRARRPAQTPAAPAPAAPATTTSSSPTPAAPAPAAPAAGTSLSIAANPSGALEYTKKTLTANAGRVTITMANMSPLEHNLTIANGSTVVGATPTFSGRLKDTVTDPEGRHLQVLLLGSGSPPGRHGRHADSQLKLYVCWGTFPTPRPGGHPCANAFHAVTDAGYEPEVIRSYGLAPLPGFLNRTRGRQEVQELTGNRWVPTLVLDDGTVIDGSQEIVSWAQQHRGPSA